MSFTTNPILLVAAAFYRIGYKIHHKLFLRPQPPLRTRIIIVGSYLAGGAGKTPFTIWLAKHFQEQGNKIAVLCHKAAWDEFVLLQQELRGSPNVSIIATKNRYATAKEIQDKFDIILCDDGFEDTRFAKATRICLDWQEPPQKLSSLLTSGPFRSLKQDHDEDEIVHLRCYEKKIESDDSPVPPDIQFSIESLTNYNYSQSLAATVICGLGSPQRFVQDVRAFGVTVEKSIIRPDHDKHFMQTVEAELATGKDIVISQKDACRLPQTLLTHPKLHVAIQKTCVSDNAIEKLSLI